MNRHRGEALRIFAEASVFSVFSVLPPFLCGENRVVLDEGRFSSNS